MLNGGQHRLRDTVASALGWWADAGVDMLAGEEPRDWLAAPVRPAPIAPAPIADTAAHAGPATAPAAAPPAAPADLPGDLAGLLALLAAGDYAPRPAPPHLRVAPMGDPAAPLMIVTDMPEAGDERAGLFSGETAALYDAMLAAMGLDRARVYCAPLSPARFAGGRIDERHVDPLARIMRRHLSLATPKALLLFGDEAARVLLGPDALAKRGGIRFVNHDGGEIPAICITHPRTLRRAPAAKAAAWRDMRLLIGELAR
jgi:uracil-DNA glycosylase